MTSESATDHTARPDASSRAWLHARELWAGLSIITMWLAVLFVGLFGGDIVTSSGYGGSSSSVPVVVTLLPFVLPATIVAARRGFTSTSYKRAVADEDTRAHEEAAAGPSALRAKPA
jgi:hypothetical protein